MITEKAPKLCETFKKWLRTKTGKQKTEVLITRSIDTAMKSCTAQEFIFKMQVY